MKPIYIHTLSRSLKRLSSFGLLSLILLGSTFFGTSCTPKLDYELEDYARQLVVECYLIEGEPARVILHESVSYLTLDSLPIISAAKVTLAHNGDTMRLQWDPPAFFVSEEPIVRDEYPWFLRVEDPVTGRVVTGETQFLPVVPMDSAYFDIDVRGKFRMLVDFRDPIGQPNYYRMTAVSRKDTVQFDLEVFDDVADGQSITLGSGHNFSNRDSVDVALYHLSEDYYNFLVSLRKASIAGTAPVVEPVRVQSNVHGGIGIFTTLNVDRKRIWTTH